MPRKMYLAMKKNFLDNLSWVSSKLQLLTALFCDPNVSGFIISQFVGYKLQAASVHSLADHSVQGSKYVVPHGYNSLTVLTVTETKYWSSFLWLH